MPRVWCGERCGGRRARNNKARGGVVVRRVGGHGLGVGKITRWRNGRLGRRYKHVMSTLPLQHPTKQHRSARLREFSLMHWIPILRVTFNSSDILLLIAIRHIPLISAASLQLMLVLRPWKSSIRKHYSATGNRCTAERARKIAFFP